MATRPAVWPWYIAYVVLMALVYLLCLGGGVALAFAGDKPEERIQGVMLAVVGLPLTVIYAAAPLLPKRPLIFWLKPETKAFFGRV